MGRKSGTYINLTGKIFLASLGSYVGAKIYEKIQDQNRIDQDEDIENIYRTGRSGDPTVDNNSDYEDPVGPPQQQYTLVKIPQKTPEELAAEEQANFEAFCAHIHERAASPEGQAFAAKMAEWDAKEAKIAAMKADGTWRWWMSDAWQGFFMMVGILWILAAPFAWGLSMILTRGDWFNSALNGVESVAYIGMKIYDGIHYLLTL